MGVCYSLHTKIPHRLMQFLEHAVHVLLQNHQKVSCKNRAILASIPGSLRFIELRNCLRTLYRCHSERSWTDRSKPPTAGVCNESPPFDQGTSGGSQDQYSETQAQVWFRFTETLKRLAVGDGLMAVSVVGERNTLSFYAFIIS